MNIRRRNRKLRAHFRKLKIYCCYFLLFFTPCLLLLVALCYKNRFLFSYPRIITVNTDAPHETNSVETLQRTDEETRDVDGEQISNAYSERLVKLPYVDSEGIMGGEMYKIPSLWNRFHTTWFQPPRVYTRTPKQSRYRYLYSATRKATSDGIGHSMGVVNFELNLALRMNLTYTHRVGLYSSLTMKDKQAVENFFGWGSGEVQRTQLQKEGCFARGGSWPREKEIYKCQVCEAPMKNGSLGIGQVVLIPSNLSGRCEHLFGSEGCSEHSKDFTNKYNLSHTIFQAPLEGCSPPVTDANLVNTKNFFFHKYWQRHGQVSPLGRRTVSETTKLIRLKPDELNIAMHIRRGDFLEPRVRKKRDVTEDSVFARVLSDVLAVIHQVGGVFADMQIAVHIYSEGRLSTTKVLSIHDVSMQDTNYYDSSGVPRNEDWWKDLIFATAERLGHVQCLSLRSRLRVKMHISEDTLTSVHEMISSDIFIGSKSGLSNSLVWSISRGIAIIPESGTINTEEGKKGIICCSIPFKHHDGRFNIERLKGYWTSYVRANEDSALHSVGSGNQYKG